MSAGGLSWLPSERSGARAPSAEALHRYFATPSAAGRTRQNRPHVREPASVQRRAGAGRAHVAMRRAQRGASG